MLSTQPLIRPLFEGPIDIVGDIHGEIDALRDLLGHLGYNAVGKHSGGRRLVFIGDLTDRGPDSPAVIELVSSFVERGLAQCLMGNHELNLLRQAPKEGNGWYFDENHDQGEGKFLTAQPLPADRRPGLRAFLESLPLALERSDLRVVHATWHEPSIAQIRSADAPVLTLYDKHQKEALRIAHETGLVDLANAELATFAVDLKNPDAQMKLLPSVGTLDALYQIGNPVRIVTSGIERVAQQPFFASGKWRMVDRVPWWDDYAEATPVIIGHYWRWPTRAAREAYSRGEPDLFADYEPHQWFGAMRNVYCVDFAVGARYKQRECGPISSFDCRLGAVRWPEQELVFDDGVRMPLSDPSKAEPDPEPSTRKQLPTTRWGRPSSVPLGTGFGISGISPQRPKKPTEEKT